MQSTKQKRLLKQNKSNKFKLPFMDEEFVDWLIVFTRDITVAILVGAILGGVIDKLEWQGITLLLLGSLLTCYTSLTLIKIKKNV
jgi:hypothetical protein